MKRVFVNIPYDLEYAPWLDTIELCCELWGVTPVLMGDRHTSSNLPEIHHIHRALQECCASIHDLARGRGAGPYLEARLNMPLELGIALGMQRPVLILHPVSLRLDRIVSDLLSPPLASPPTARASHRHKLSLDYDLAPYADHPSFASAIDGFLARAFPQARPRPRATATTQLTTEYRTRLNRCLATSRKEPRHTALRFLLDQERRTELLRSRVPQTVPETPDVESS